MRHFFLFSMLAIFVFSITAAGCNTMRGAGEDVESAGESIQDAAE